MTATPVKMYFKHYNKHNAQNSHLGNNTHHEGWMDLGSLFGSCSDIEFLHLPEILHSALWVS